MLIGALLAMRVIHGRERLWIAAGMAAAVGACARSSVRWLHPCTPPISPISPPAKAAPRPAPQPRSSCAVATPAAIPGFSTAGDPLLGPLADNGGPVPTLLPGAGSPAIDGVLEKLALEKA